MKKYILVVDPVISCKYLIDRLRKNNFNIFAFFTSDIQLPYFKKSIDLVTFDKILVSSKDVSIDIHNINQLLSGEEEIIFCLYGSDYSSAYADQLSEVLTPLLANNMNSSALRNDKSEMIKALNQQKIPAPQQSIITQDNMSDIEALEFPIVIKPGHNSAGSDGVKLCRDSSIARKHIGDILNNAGLYGLNVTHAVIQEFLQGTEYCVNTASYSGEHRLCSIFRYTKTMRDNQFIYRYLDLVNQDFYLLNYIFSYVKDILKVLEFNNGLAHTEIMLVENVCKLIELNPRIAGFSGQMNKLEDLALKTNQVDIFCDLIRNQDEVKAEYDECHYRMYFLQNFNFTYEKINTEDLTTLASFVECKVMVPSFNSVKKSISLTDVAAFIILKSNCKEQLEKDTKTIMSLEESGYFFSKTQQGAVIDCI